jgi:PAS domain-containing protein
MSSPIAVPIDLDVDVANPPVSRVALWRGIGLSLLAAAVFFAALFSIFHFIGAARDRGIAEWQTRLSIVADSRREAVQTWIRTQRLEIARLVANDSVALYVSAILEPGTGKGAPEAQYLRNLLKATATRAGYLTPVSSTIPANVARDRRAGLAILGKDGSVLVSTDAMPNIDADQRKFILGAKRRGVHLIDLYPGARGRPTIGLVSPLLSSSGEVLAYIVGIKPVARELYPLLKQPGATQKTAEAILVRPVGPILEYISPLQNKTRPLRLKLARRSVDLAAAIAVSAPGAFFMGKDYRGRDTLGVSRQIGGTPWILVYKVDQDDALGEIDSHLSRMLIILLLALALVIVAFLAVWRHGASRRAGMAASAYRRVAQELEQQRNLLRVVTDNQPDAIFIVDDQDTYRFANMATAQGGSMRPEDIDGKTLTNVLGPKAARRLERLNREALDTNQPVIDVMRDGSGRQLRVIQSKHVPLPSSNELKRSVLVVEEDITTAIVERERRERNLQSLVQALVTVVDRRDPNAAHHSIRVSLMAKAVASEMALRRDLVDTVGFAGDLLNIGKLMVPQELLTKPDKLSPEELVQVQSALDSGPDLLSGIEFDGPVVDTIRQARERWDGSGRPKGMKGDDILVTARIVAVADAFVAMGSPRAHRPAMDVDGTLDMLLGDVGKGYDRRVVAALANYMDNKGGRTTWAKVSDAKLSKTPPIES